MRSVLCTAVGGLALLVLSLASQAQTAVSVDATPAWMTAMALRHKELIEINGPGTNQALAKELLGMQQRDQEVRKPLLANPPENERPAVPAKMLVADRQLTSELKTIVSKNGWPAIPEVGYDASNAAMLVLIHSEDHAWQSNLIPVLQKLVDTDKIDGSEYALLVDKELVSEGKPQLYGTQFKFEKGAMAMYIVSDPAGLDSRRAKAMLMPLDVYKQLLASTYHVQTTDMIVAPTKGNGLDR